MNDNLITICVPHGKTNASKSHSAAAPLILEGDHRRQVQVHFVIQASDLKLNQYLAALFVDP